MIIDVPKLFLNGGLSYYFRLVLGESGPRYTTPDSVNHQ